MQLRFGLRELELHRPLLEAVAGGRLFPSRRLPPGSGGAACFKPGV